MDSGNFKKVYHQEQEERIPFNQRGAVLGGGGGEERIPFNQRVAVMGGGGGEEEFERYSVYVDNVDYWCTAEDLKTHFECCGKVNRITIPTNEFGTPQGHAYVEFSDLDSVDKALLQLNSSVLCSREITVSRKKKRPNNNNRRGFRGPIQQQEAVNSRTMNRSSRPPNANPRGRGNNGRGRGNNGQRWQPYPQQQQQPQARGAASTLNINKNRPNQQLRPPPTSSSNSRFSYVRPIGITTSTADTSKENIKPAQAPTARAPTSSRPTARQ